MGWWTFEQNVGWVTGVDGWILLWLFWKLEHLWCYEKTLTNQMYVHKRPVYNMVSLRLEPKGEVREIYLELQKCICTFLPHICGAEQIVSLALVLRNMSRPPSRPALTRALCLLCSDQSDDIWIITNLKTTTALNSQLACDPLGCRSCLPFIRQEWYALKWFWPANFQLKVYKKKLNLSSQSLEFRIVWFKLNSDRDMHNHRQYLFLALILFCFDLEAVYQPNFISM